MKKLVILASCIAMFSASCRQRVEDSSSGVKEDSKQPYQPMSARVFYDRASGKLAVKFHIDEGAKTRAANADKFQKPLKLILTPKGAGILTDLVYPKGKDMDDLKQPVYVAKDAAGLDINIKGTLMLDSAMSLESIKISVDQQTCVDRLKQCFTLPVHVQGADFEDYSRFEE